MSERAAPALPHVLRAQARLHHCSACVHPCGACVHPCCACVHPCGSMCASLIIRTPCGGRRAVEVVHGSGAHPPHTLVAHSLGFSRKGWFLLLKVVIIWGVCAPLSARVFP